MSEVMTARLQHYNFKTIEMMKRTFLTILLFVVAFTTVQAQEPHGKIEKVWSEHNVINNGEKGMNIHAKFNVSNLKNRTGEIYVFFYFSNGSIVNAANRNNNYSTTKGYLKVDGEYTPNYDNSTFNDYILFFPYSEFSYFQNGKYELKYYVNIYDDNNNKLAESTAVSFIYTRNSNTSPVAQKVVPPKTPSSSSASSAPMGSYQVDPFGNPVSTAASSAPSGTYKVAPSGNPVSTVMSGFFTQSGTTKNDWSGCTGFNNCGLIEARGLREYVIFDRLSSAPRNDSEIKVWVKKEGGRNYATKWEYLNN